MKHGYIWIKVIKRDQCTIVKEEWQIWKLSLNELEIVSVLEEELVIVAGFSENKRLKLWRSERNIKMTFTYYEGIHRIPLFKSTIPLLTE